MISQLQTRLTAPSVLMFATQPIHNILCHNSLGSSPVPSLLLSKKRGGKRRDNKGLELMDVNESSMACLSVGRV